MSTSKILQALVLPTAAITDELSSLEQAKISQQIYNSPNMQRNLTINIDPEKLKIATNQARNALATLINSDDFKKVMEQANEAVKRKRWATDPLDLMQYWNYFKLVSLRRNLANFLYELARSIDPDLVD